MTQPNTPNFPWNQEYILRPVGFVESALKEPGLGADRRGLKSNGCAAGNRTQRNDIKKIISRIVVRPDLDGILDGLAKFSHALILYWPHLAKPESRALRKVHPMGRRDIAEVGVFASCSPGRPNPILVTAVKLLDVTGNVLTVQGLEAVDQSPVLDIKPYSRHYLVVEELKPAPWMEKIERESEE